MERNIFVCHRPITYSDLPFFFEQKLQRERNISIFSWQFRVKIWFQVTEANESTPSWCLWHHLPVGVHRTAEAAFSFSPSAIMMDVYMFSLRANYLAFVWGPRITHAARLHRALLDLAERIVFSVSGKSLFRLPSHSKERWMCLTEGRVQGAESWEQRSYPVSF